MVRGDKMALICDVELENGLKIEGAYHRIASFSGTETYLNFNVDVYVKKAVFDEGRPSVTSKRYEMTFDKDRNLFRQMYECLRTLPEYEDAVEA